MIEQFDEQGRPIVIKIGPYDYKVIWHPDMGRQHDLCGQHDSVRQQIMVDPELPAQQRAVTFMHEVLHGLFYLSRSEKDTLDLEEQAHTYSVALTAFWRDNPQTLKWWEKLIG